MLRKMNQIKIKIKNKMAKFKQNFKDYFLREEKSIKNLIKFLRKFYVFTYGFDELYLGTTNSKRLKVNKIITILSWLVTLEHLLLVILDDLWSIVDGQFLPEHFRIFMVMLLIILFLVASIKTDCLLSEINYRLDKTPFKVFYFLMINSNHGLNRKNRKKLAILSRIIQIFMLDYAVPIFTLLISTIFISITILSQKVAWILQSILTIGFIQNAIFVLTSDCCLVYIYFTYYKFKFDQFHTKIFKLINVNLIEEMINLRKERKLIRLINQHNRLSIEIHRFNLSIRRCAAVMFVAFCLIKIISLYLVEHTTNSLYEILFQNIFFVFLICTFGLSILYSIQIKSAHQSYKLIYSIICKYKMRLSLKLKVIKTPLKFN